MEQEVLKSEYQKYLESIISITFKPSLKETLKYYLDKGYVLTELNDGYAFLGMPDDSNEYDYYKKNL